MSCNIDVSLFPVKCAQITKYVVVEIGCVSPGFENVLDVPEQLDESYSLINNVVPVGVVPFHHTVAATGTPDDWPE